MFTNLKSELEFQWQLFGVSELFGASEPVKFLVGTLKLYYTSNRAISQIIDTLDLARHEGVIQDLVAQRPDRRDPYFESLLDCGSGQAHFREFIRFDIKLEDKEGNMVCRILGFPNTH